MQGGQGSTGCTTLPPSNSPTASNPQSDPSKRKGDTIVFATKSTDQTRFLLAGMAAFHRLNCLFPLMKLSLQDYCFGWGDSLFPSTRAWKMNGTVSFHRWSVPAGLLLLFWELPLSIDGVRLQDYCCGFGDCLFPSNGAGNCLFPSMEMPLVNGNGRMQDTTWCWFRNRL